MKLFRTTPRQSTWDFMVRETTACCYDVLFSFLLGNDCLGEGVSADCNGTQSRQIAAINQRSESAYIHTYTQTYICIKVCNYKCKPEGAKQHPLLIATQFDQTVFLRLEFHLGNCIFLICLIWVGWLDFINNTLFMWPFYEFLNNVVNHLQRIDWWKASFKAIFRFEKWPFDNFLWFCLDFLPLMVHQFMEV